MADTLLAFNGVDGSTGEYLMQPQTARQVARLARGEKPDQAHFNELKRRLGQREKRLGLRAGLDARSLDQAGWGVIFARDADPAIREALGVLLDHRRAQASANDERLYREYSGERGYRPGESKDRFVVRNGAVPGPVDPKRMPYYLLLVGGPEEVAFDFQHQLDVAYAVGRIQFDSVEEYASYAQSVVSDEREGAQRPRRATFFGVQNEDDQATSLSATRLVKPLAERVAAVRPTWSVQTVLGREARKARLAGLLGGPDTPALLFTASHGLGFSRADPRQTSRQGALLCQDWPGPRTWGPREIPPSFYLAAEDIADDARPGGLISFHFACFSAGTPRFDEFAHEEPGRRNRVIIAPRAFVAGLPKRLLGHPNGGALAVVGHVDRAWGSSFGWDGSDEAQLTTFESAIEYLLDGYPVGAALEFFNERYAELAVSVSSILYAERFGTPPDVDALAAMWTANNDARGYAIVGDPAVRLSAPCGTPSPSMRPAGVEVTSPAPRSAAAVAPAKPTEVTESSARSAASSMQVAEGDPVDAGRTDDGRVRLREAHQELSDRLRRAVERATGDVTGDLPAAAPSLEPDDVLWRDSQTWARQIGPVRQAQPDRAELLELSRDAISALADAIEELGRS